MAEDPDNGKLSADELECLWAKLRCEDGSAREHMTAEPGTDVTFD